MAALFRAPHLSAAMELLAAILERLRSIPARLLAAASAKFGTRSFMTAASEVTAEFATEAPIKSMIVAIKAAAIPTPATPITGEPASAIEARSNPKRTGIRRQSPIAGDELAIRIVIAVNPNVSGSRHGRPHGHAYPITRLRIRGLLIAILGVTLLRIRTLLWISVLWIATLGVSSLRWIIRVASIQWVLLSKQRPSRHHQKRRQFRFHFLLSPPGAALECKSVANI